MTIIQLPELSTGDSLDLVDADAYDFYRQIHKGIRHALFHTTMRAGNLDVTDPDEVDAFLLAHSDLLELLHQHHDHEDEYFQPLIEVHAPELALLVAAQHGQVDEGMARLEQLAARLTTAGATARSGAALNLHLDLSRLVSAYLAHQLVEETQVMPALRSGVPSEELFAIDMALRASVPPDDMVKAMQHMLPAMDLEERVEMLTGMQMAPPEIFAIFRQAAEVILPADQWREVARRIGVT